MFDLFSSVISDSALEEAALAGAALLAQVQPLDFVGIIILVGIAALLLAKHGVLWFSCCCSRSAMVIDFFWCLI